MRLAAPAFALAIAGCWSGAQPQPVVTKPDAPPPATKPRRDTGDIGEHSLALMEDIGDIIVAHESDCPRMGAELQKFVAKHRAEIDEINAWEKSDLDAYKAWTEKHEDRFEAWLQRAQKGFTACANDPTVDAALKALE